MKFSFDRSSIKKDREGIVKNIKWFEDARPKPLFLFLGSTTQSYCEHMPAEAPEDHCSHQFENHVSYGLSKNGQNLLQHQYHTALH